MTDHKETLEQTAKRIEASFAKIEQYGKKADEFRISAGKMLVELQARIDDGEAGKGVKWWSWYAEHFQNRTRRDASKVMALARSDDPEGDLEKERKKAREGMKRLRDKEGMSHAGHDPQPGSDEDGDRTNWTIQQHADAIRQLVLREIAELEDVVDEIDVLRDTVLRELTFALTPPAKEVEPAKEIGLELDEPPKKKGRPTGSKNKPKEFEAAGNTGDAEAEAEAQKAKNAAMFGDDDLSNPEHPLHRPDQEAA